MTEARSPARLRALAAALWLASFAAQGCAGHEARTAKMRTALDAGDAKRAVAELNEELDVKRDSDLPPKVVSDEALLLLDRATVQQELGAWANSERDYQAADKAIDMLDLSRGAGDSLGEYVFSDSSGRYKAPPYEKLLVNTLNLLNYLEQGDLSGARIEARRLAVMRRYLKERVEDSDTRVLALGGLLAGFAHEQAGEVDEALRWYDEAAAARELGWLAAPVKRLLARGHYTSPRLVALAGRAEGDASEAEGTETGEGEVLFVTGWGRVPHKVPERIPIGLALTYVSGAISPGDRVRANELAAQGLVTWVNFPTLGASRGASGSPTGTLDGGRVVYEPAADLEAEVRREWKKLEGKVIASAITRLVARYAAGKGVQAAAGSDSLAGVLLSLGTQATLTALDTPDTRSWETLPARVSIARVRVRAGKHTATVRVRGLERTETFELAPGGFKVVSLFRLG